MHFWILFLAIFFLALPVQAKERQELLHELATYQIKIVEPETFPLADLYSLLKGARTLPESTWSTLNRTFEIQYRPTPCLFGMGRYSESCPTLQEGRRQEIPRFFLYDSPPLLGEGPVESLHILTREEQREIQVGRALIHLIMVYLDREFQWSRQALWRSINGWPSRRGNALNQDPWGFSRVLGMRSAHLDLVTFAEEYFLRPEDLLLEKAMAGDEEAQRRLKEHFDPDLSMACQQFTKRRILTELLQELESTWGEPIRNLPHLSAGGPQCPAFEMWTRPHLIDEFDILLAAATSNQPESLYGHLLLHVRYKSDGRVHSTGFEPVYQFGAVTDTDVSSIVYFTRGLLGGFPSILEFNTFRGIDRIFLQYQQRSLQRYTLQLSEDEKRQFLERIWEGERRIRYPYVFLPNNCASFLVDLLSPIVDPTLFEGQGRIVMPTDVLDTLARAKNSAGEPLLVKRPDALRSNREIAEEAILERRSLVRNLQSKVIAGAQKESALDLQLKLSGLLASFEDPSPARRAEAFEETEALFEELLSHRPELAGIAIDILYTGVLIERYFMELAHFARRQVYLRTGSPPEHQTAAEILRERRELYRHEDLEERVRVINERASTIEGLVQPQSTREFTPQEQAILDREALTRATYMKALQAQSNMVASHKPGWNGVAYLEGRSLRYLEEMQRIDDLSIGPSGRNRLTLGGGFDASMGLPTLEVSFSAIEDRLGEIRRQGYPGNLESRVLSLDAIIPLDVGSFPGLFLDLTIFRYLSIERSYAPITQGLLHRFGWAIDASLVHDSRRNLNASVELTPSLLLPLWTARDHVHHLVLEGGMALRHDVHNENTFHLGLRAALFGQLHLYGSYANVLRFGLSTQQFFTQGLEWAYDYSAHMQSRHALFHVNQRPFFAIPFLEISRTSRTYTGDDHFDTLRGGLKVELPF